MRCECCDRILSDKEATSKFAASGLFTNMCTECQGFMPKDVKILNRRDLEEGDFREDLFDYSADDDESSPF